MDFAAVADTDRGRWDGDTTWDRAVGPMQFLSGTWLTYGVDGDGHSTADPQDVEDAAASIAAYLCYGIRDLAVPAQQASALLAYNHSYAYPRLVQTYENRYVRSGLDFSAAVEPWPMSANTATPPLSSGAGGPGHVRLAH